MNLPNNRKYLECITEEDLKMALQSAKSNNPQAFLILAKMYCAQKGMTDTDWEDIFREEKTIQRLRQMGVPQGFVTEIVACSIQAVLDHQSPTRHFLSIDDKQGELKCSICPQKPYKAMTIVREEKGSDSMNPLIVVLCKEHVEMVAEKHDGELTHFIWEQSKLYEH